uniref:Ddr2 n=1 Tax=Leptinotarsa decemlineata TaxID=7539 RepID=A0A0U3U674_LEPDE|nr:Ddr2 [Leptinotarsa decemlineata]
MFLYIQFKCNVLFTSCVSAQCIAPLGMENGAIRDSDITASSSFDKDNVGPQHGRVRTDKNGGAWCPQKQATTEPEEWIQLDLGSVHMITATETQGRFGNGQGIEYAEAYIIEYWRPRLRKWVRYHNSKGEEVMIFFIQIWMVTADTCLTCIGSFINRFLSLNLNKKSMVIPGNVNPYLEAKRELIPPIWASKLRFYPYSYHKRTVCMRVELYGCEWTNGVISYSMPQGDKRGNNWEFYDFGSFSYDGQWIDNELKDGLGQLVDGKIGPDDYKADYSDDHSWVGWKNDTRDNKPIEVTFEFDKVREFFSLQIYCSNQFTKEIQVNNVVFSSVKVLFSISGKQFNEFEPITYEYVEERIFETARNITVKLHHNVGQYLKLYLYFASKWILISEVSFDSIISHGNFSIGHEPTIDPKAKPEDDRKIEISKLPKEEDGPARYQYKKMFGTSPSSNIGIPGNRSPHLYPESAYGVDISEKGSSIEAYKFAGIGEYMKSHDSKSTKSMNSTLPLPHSESILGNNEYQEPYQSTKYSPYYSYSPVVNEIQNEMPRSPKKNQFLRGKFYDQKDALTSLKKRLKEQTIMEFPRHRLRMVSKLSEGVFGTVYIAEAGDITEHSSPMRRKLVAIKFLDENASEEKRYIFKDFYRDVRILSALEDPNLARVLGICSQEEPLCVVMEYLEHGDLCQFLRTHTTTDDPAGLPNGSNSISFNSLIYMGVQVARGMQYLESLNFVHRDLATRNCLVGNNYQIKICDFGTYNELYTNDYYKVDGNTPLPIRWMAWESVYQARLFFHRYTTKSDVWGFAVTLWEILTLCRQPPFSFLSDSEVMENLAHLHYKDGQFNYLPRPSNHKDIYDVMMKCWQRDETERPTFTEIHYFLQEKSLGYSFT